MRIRIVAALTVVALSFAFVGAQFKADAKTGSSSTSAPVVSTETGAETSGSLQIIKSSEKFTQEQVASQIKAEYLIENGGYKDSDEVVVILSLEKDSLIDTYNSTDTGAKSVAEYAESFAGTAEQAEITASQNVLVEKLSKKGLINGVVASYSTIMNGVAVKTSYGNLKTLSSFDGVKSAILSDEYNRAETTASASADVATNVVEIEDTGIYKNTTQYTGKGTSVAILDSGFDMSHSVFQIVPEEGENGYSITEDYLLSKDADGKTLIQKTIAAKTTSGLKLADVWYSTKIPFSYDYADKDADVFPYDSEHGTHVAGIIGGKDSVIQGVAIDTQLVLMKVFPDLDAGGRTEDILAALEDAVLLNVDAINMSLGSSCGFVREVDGSEINRVYDAINASGISLITAASNSYSSAYGGEQGNTNFVTNPDSGTVGSPSTYAAALSVASVSGTKSRYMVANASSSAHTFFYKESNAIDGTQNDFYKELVAAGFLADGETKTFEYVTIPGVGTRGNYSQFGSAESKPLQGKIVLVRRGDNTFEDKARIAKMYGAAGCIIYNNVYGDILMSMGKTDHIPTISISKEDGEKLAAHSKGTLTVSGDYLAGPFMSEFSSWGPTPSLQIKPEITAHGGNIKSSVPGSYDENGNIVYKYDELSGTSMATPNLCGVIVLIRQYVKETYPDLSDNEVKNLVNQLLMSTATIIKNEENNPYSPRKQGAGLGDLTKTTKTKAYLSVDGIDRTKLELGDDKKRTGVYEMNFNLVNLSAETLSYDLSLDAMTETVSSSDKNFVAETPYMLGNSHTVSLVEGDGTVNGDKITIAPNATVKLKVVYTMDDADKKYIDASFAYGMYVEGFVKLAADYDDGVDLNIPYLAFYGDWTEAPMFDKTYYEVESEAHNAAIDDEDKIKADYYATTPYGSYFYNYMIPLGTYLYDVDESKYDVIPASTEHIAISDTLGTIDGINTVAAGLLRGAKEMKFVIVDKATGEVVWEHTDYNATKSYAANGATPNPYYDGLNISSYEEGFVNNRTYEFKMTGLLDYGDGGATTNVRNSFSFDFYFDNEAPVLKEATYEKIYDKTLKKDRYYITLTIYDNHYVQAVTPIIFTSSSSYTLLTDNPIPVYGEKGANATVRFEITDILADNFADALVSGSLAFSIDDYALNSNIYVCQLPGTNGSFKFTKTGEADSSDLIILNVNEGDIVDVSKYLYSDDKNVDETGDYIKYLDWTSSDDAILQVKNGLLKANAVGKATITVGENVYGRQAVLIVNVRPEGTPGGADKETVANKIQELRFSYFETTFAFSRAAQTSEIGSTGDVKFLNATNGSVSMYPGERIRLSYDFKPWYAEDGYTFRYEATNDKIASVDEDGNIRALKEGSTTISLIATDKKTGKDSNIRARITLIVKSEFVIENRTLVAYKGLGGVVEIPDDEGILYIGSFAFCLYTTDNNIKLDDDDLDGNKIPESNDTVTKVIIPEGVEEIQRYAFYNCAYLKEVVIPDSVKYVREYSFYNDKRLENVRLGDKAEVIGAFAFKGCEKLKSINLDRIYSIGIRAFEGCKALETANLSTLRNTGREAFKDCESLKSVTMNADGHTKLSYAMFVNSGLEAVDIYEKISVPQFCFANCEKLETVNFKNSLSVGIESGAFSGCSALKTVNFENGVKVPSIGEQVFYNDKALETFVLPDGDVSIGGYAFYECSSLKTVKFGANTKIVGLSGSTFETTDLKNFVVDSVNPYYSVSDDRRLLLNKVGDAIILAAPGYEFGNYTLPSSITAIGDGAFSGVNITSLKITSPVSIGDYAFCNCDKLISVELSGVDSIGAYAFAYTENLTAIDLSNVDFIGAYAFSGSAIKNVVLADGCVVEEGGFYNSKVERLEFGKNVKLGLGSFQRCYLLKTIVAPVVADGENGGVVFGDAIFAYDTGLVGMVDLKNVMLSEIPMQAFFGCSSLAKVNLTGVTKIGSGAFADCAGLGTVILSEGLVEIGDSAFAKMTMGGYAPAFKNITIPSTLEKLGEGAFLGCSNLEKIDLSATNVSFPDKTLSDEELDSQDSSVSHFTGNYVFYACSSLEEVKLPESVDRIGLYMFGNCYSLSKINLGKIVEIDDFAFSMAQSSTSQSNLSSVDLSSVRTIGDYAFFNCSWLASSVYSDDLESIGEYAFGGTRIASVWAENLKTIGAQAFNGVETLKVFYIGEKIESIGAGAFVDCDGLEKFSTYPSLVSFEGSTNAKVNDYAEIKDGVLYVAMPSGNLQLLCVPAGMELDTLVVADGTYRIETHAARGNKSIRKIVLPDTLKFIGNYAFYGCSALEEVEFKSFVAPALEDGYTSLADVVEGDFAYDLLHKHYDLFELELCYYNFKDLVGKACVKNNGKTTHIKMTLPSNAGVQGYDSIVYEAYFGKVSEATRSAYEAMDKNMSDFIEYAKKIAEKKVIMLTDETLVENALRAYNASKQDPSKFGYSAKAWDALYQPVAAAKLKINELKLANSSDKLKALAAKIKALPTQYDSSVWSVLAEITSELDSLNVSDKLLLDLTVYDALMDEYNAYVDGVNSEFDAIDSVVNAPVSGGRAAAQAAATATGLALLAFVAKKKFI